MQAANIVDKYFTSGARFDIGLEYIEADTTNAAVDGSNSIVSSQSHAPTSCNALFDDTAAVLRKELLSETFVPFRLSEEYLELIRVHSMVGIDLMGVLASNAYCNVFLLHLMEKRRHLPLQMYMDIRFTFQPVAAKLAACREDPTKGGETMTAFLKSQFWLTVTNIYQKYLSVSAPLNVPNSTYEIGRLETMMVAKGYMNAELVRKPRSLSYTFIKYGGPKGSDGAAEGMDIGGEGGNGGVVVTQDEGNGDGEAREREEEETEVSPGRGSEPSDEEVEEQVAGILKVMCVNLLLPIENDFQAFRFSTLYNTLLSNIGSQSHPTSPLPPSGDGDGPSPLPPSPSPSVTSTTSKGGGGGAGDLKLNKLINMVVLADGLSTHLKTTSSSDGTLQPPSSSIKSEGDREVDFLGCFHIGYDASVKKRGIVFSSSYSDSEAGPQDVNALKPFIVPDERNILCLTNAADKAPEPVLIPFMFGGGNIKIYGAVLQCYIPLQDISPDCPLLPEDLSLPPTDPRLLKMGKGISTADNAVTAFIAASASGKKIQAIELDQVLEQCKQLKVSIDDYLDDGYPGLVFNLPALKVIVTSLKVMLNNLSEFLLKLKTASPQDVYAARVWDEVSKLSIPFHEGKKMDKKIRSKEVALEECRYYGVSGIVIISRHEGSSIHGMKCKLRDIVARSCLGGTMDVDAVSTLLLTCQTGKVTASDMVAARSPRKTSTWDTVMSNGFNSLEALFTCLSVPNILKVVCALILERKILLVSSRYSILSLVSEGLMEMIKPLQWCHIYVPLLPKKMVYTLNCPAPFICGVHTSYAFMDKFPSEIECDVVYLDTDQIRFFREGQLSLTADATSASSISATHSPAPPLPNPATSVAPVHTPDTSATTTKVYNSNITSSTGTAINASAGASRAEERRGSLPQSSSEIFIPPSKPATLTRRSSEMDLRGGGQTLAGTPRRKSLAFVHPADMSPSLYPSLEGFQEAAEKLTRLINPLFHFADQVDFVDCTPRGKHLPTEKIKAVICAFALDSLIDTTLCLKCSSPIYNTVSVGGGGTESGREAAGVIFDERKYLATGGKGKHDFFASLVRTQSFSQLLLTLMEKEGKLKFAQG